MNIPTILCSRERVARMNNIYEEIRIANNSAKKNKVEETYQIKDNIMQPEVDLKKKTIGNDSVMLEVRQKVELFENALDSPNLPQSSTLSLLQPL